MPEVGWRPAIMRSSAAMAMLLTALTVLAIPARADLPEAERLAGPRAPAAQARNFADELTDFGITPKAELEPDFATPTPMTIPGAKVIRTAEAAALVREQRVLFVDVLLGAPHRTIPGALQLPGAGSARTFADDEILRKLGVTLAAYTKGDLDLPIAFFCYGAECWEVAQRRTPRNRPWLPKYLLVPWWVGSMECRRATNCRARIARPSSAAP